MKSKPHTFTRELQFKFTNKDYSFSYLFTPSQPIEIEKSTIFSPLQISVEEILQKLNTNPTDYSTIPFTYENTNYQLLPESLLALSLNDAIEIVEKLVIIKDVTISFTENYENLQSMKDRIYSALISIGMNCSQKETSLNEIYDEQSEILNDLIQKRKMNIKYMKMIKRAQELMKNDNVHLDICENEIVEEFASIQFDEMKKKLTFSERTKYKLEMLDDNYAVFIASKYFNDLKDHVSLIRVCRRFQYNMTKFFYNPISMTKSQAEKFFPNIRTWFFYHTFDTFVSFSKHLTYNYIPHISTHEYNTIVDKHKNMNIIFQNVHFTVGDRNREFKKSNNTICHSIYIPKVVKYIDNDCFNNWNYVNKINFHPKFQINDKFIISECTSLTSISLSLNSTQMIIGNKIYGKDSHFDQIIYLPSTIKVINDKYVFPVDSMTIPKYVTSIGDGCFHGCNQTLKQLVLPTSISRIDGNWDKNCISVTKIDLPSTISYIKPNCSLFDIVEQITIPQSLTYFDHNWFKFNFSLKQITLPDSIKEMSKDAFHNFRIEHLDFPSSMTCFKSKWFIGCTTLTSLNLTSSIVNIKWNALLGLTNLKKIYIPSPWVHYGEKVFRNIDGCLHSIELPSSVKCCNQRIPYKMFFYSIPSDVTKLADCCFANCQELQVFYGMENVKEFGKNCFFNSPRIDTSLIPLFKDINNKWIFSEGTRNVLEKWTGKKCGDVLFNSMVHNWSHGNSDFKKNLHGKIDIMILIEEENGELFGNYHSKQQNKSFHFNICPNKRFNNPVKFDIMKNKQNIFKLYDDTDEFMQLATVGDITLMKKERKDQSWYCQHNTEYCYNKNIPNALCANHYDWNGCVYFIPKRIVVIQMK